MAKEVSKLDGKKEKLNGQLAKLKEAMEIPDYITKVRYKVFKWEGRLRDGIATLFPESSLDTGNEIPNLREISIFQHQMSNASITDFERISFLTFSGVISNFSGPRECSKTEYREGSLSLVNYFLNFLRLPKHLRYVFSCLPQLQQLETELGKIEKALASFKMAE